MACHSRSLFALKAGPARKLKVQLSRVCFQPSGTSSSQSGASASASSRKRKHNDDDDVDVGNVLDEDDVRAPIPQKRETLVQVCAN